MEKTTRRLPIVERDEWLLPAEQELNRRYERYTDKINAIEQAAGSIVDYANGYRYFGWQRDELLDGKRLFEDITYPDSNGREFFAIPDGSYLRVDPDGERFCGEVWRIADGVCEKIQ